MVKSLSFFLSCSKCFISEFFFRFAEILFNLARTFAAHHEKSFVPVVFLRSIDHLFDNLESGKRNYCFGKSLAKVLNFGSKNLYEPWT